MHSAALLLGLAVSSSSVATAALIDARNANDDGVASFATVAPTDAWVRVDDEGQPATTLTPSVVTSDQGMSSVVDAAPHDLTASVYTWTSWGALKTSTGLPPNPTATNTRTNEGAFSRCISLEGDFAPFCRPLGNSTLLTGNTYYVTWDPDYFNRSSTPSSTLPAAPSSTPSQGRLNITYEVAVRIDFLNQTSQEMLKLQTHDRVPNSWGFWPWYLDKSYLKGYRSNNVTLTLLVYSQGSSQLLKRSMALPVSLAAPALDSMAKSKMPHGTTLAIALPLSLGAFALLLVGVCLWNKKTRRIQLGNVMSRSRFHRSRRSGRDGRRRRILRAVAADADAKNSHAIQLHSAPLSSTPDSPSFRDLTPTDDEMTLGSLTNSPVQENFEQQSTTGGGTGGGRRNVFREELRRQDGN